jgi:hypothetical protein
MTASDEPDNLAERQDKYCLLCTEDETCYHMFLVYHGLAGLVSGLDFTKNMNLLLEFGSIIGMRLRI